MTRQQTIPLAMDRSFQPPGAFKQGPKELHLASLPQAMGLYVLSLAAEAPKLPLSSWPETPPDKKWIKKGEDKPNSAATNTLFKVSDTSEDETSRTVPAQDSDPDDDNDDGTKPGPSFADREDTPPPPKRSRR